MAYLEAFVAFGVFAGLGSSEVLASAADLASFAGSSSSGFASAACVGAEAGGTGFGSALKVSTNFVSVNIGANFWMSMAIPRLAICMPST